jgi:uncharacterized protein
MMDKETDELIDYARREIPEFRRLELEHHEIEKEIFTRFESKKYLTPEEDIERKTLQKMKLSKKDRMFHILHDLRAVV